MPKDAKPGTHWGLILVRRDNPASKSGSSGHSVGVNYVVQLAYVIYVDVGQLAPSGKVTAIQVTPPGSSSGQQTTFQIGFQNTGDALMDIQGRLELRTLDGTLADTLPIATHPVLPGGFSQIAVSGEKPLQAGTYLATAVLNDGSPRLIAGQAKVQVGSSP